MYIDGAMGTMIQRLRLEEEDFRGNYALSAPVFPPSPHLGESAIDENPIDPGTGAMIPLDGEKRGRTWTPSQHYTTQKANQKKMAFSFDLDRSNVTRLSVHSCTLFIEQTPLWFPQSCSIARPERIIAPVGLRHSAGKEGIIDQETTELSGKFT